VAVAQPRSRQLVPDPATAPAQPAARQLGPPVLPGAGEQLPPPILYQLDFVHRANHDPDPFSGGLLKAYLSRGHFRKGYFKGFLVNG
jgi:hypothetical protein